MQSKIEHSYGAFVGAAVGDAAGASLEFYRGGKITEKTALNAMTMPGGGQLQIGKGQFTDDTECAISLAFALYDKDPKNGLPIEDIAHGYCEWYHSRPFDMGNTCAKAFSVIPRKDGYLANRMMQIVSNASDVSEANGAAMRCVPIAIWSIGQPCAIIAHNAKLDSMLSHPSQVCQDCNAIIVLAIEYLIRNSGDYEGSIEYLNDYVLNNITSTVKYWYCNDSLDISQLDCSKNIGWVKWAFIQTIYYLRNNISYETAIKEVLMRGGDTDTNACICGGVLGALHGIDKIPKYMLDPVMKFDPTQPDNGHKRPIKYSATNVYGLVHKMLKY